MSDFMAHRRRRRNSADTEKGRTRLRPKAACGSVVQPIGAEVMLPLSAAARLLSASSSVLRDVAIFMRMWFSPPTPYDAPWFMCTLAVLTKWRSIICSGVSGLADGARLLLASAASAFALILLATALTSNHER